MDYGKAIFNLKGQLLISSVKCQGSVYPCNKKAESNNLCISCKKQGKYRTVIVRNGRIYGYKHPEVDHHVNCKPITFEESAEDNERVQPKDNR